MMEPESRMTSSRKNENAFLDKGRDGALGETKKEPTDEETTTKCAPNKHLELKWGKARALQACP